MHFQAPGAALSVSLSSLLPQGDLKVVCYPASSRRSPGSFVSGSRATAPPPPTPCIARLLERPLSAQVSPASHVATREPGGVRLTSEFREGRCVCTGTPPGHMGSEEGEFQVSLSLDDNKGL